jgi:plastocyanin
MKTIITKLAAALSMAALIIAPLATPLSAANADQSQVTIYDNYYSPQTITIARGSTVTWVNSGTMNHTVTSDTGLFNSGTLTPASTYSITFSATGTFAYHCQFHQGMTGTVIVQETGGNSSTNSLTASVVAAGPGSVVINSITPMQTAGTADNNFDHGFKWVFDVTAPANEPNLAMKFENWVMNNSNATMAVANNLRFYSQQSSNAYDQNTALYITGSGTYSGWMFLNGDLDNSPQTRRVQITVEYRIPAGSLQGTYTTNFGIKTQ